MSQTNPMTAKLNWCITGSVLLLDQITKYIAKSNLYEGQSIEVVPNFFNFTLVYNPGAAFGMFGGLPDFWRRTVLIAVSIIALIVVFRFMLNEAKEDRWAQAALAGVLGGAIGNIIDRFRFDAVVDFLDFYVKEHHWPAFNIADSAISVGVFVLVVRLLFGQTNNASPEQNTTISENAA